MKSDETPFPRGWWATSLENVGLADQRPPVGTYGRYEQTSLPQLPIQLDGQFAWLNDEPLQEEHIGFGWDGNDQDDDIASCLEALRAACDASGIALPQSFQVFFSDPNLCRRIRSCTGCYISLPNDLARSPVSNGALIRFLADSQGCVFWYLYLPDGSSDHAVVSSGKFFGTESEMQELQKEEAQARHDEIVFAEESFEAFMFRFWIENELWFSEYDETPVSSIGRQYLKNYRSAPPDKLKDRALY